MEGTKNEVLASHFSDIWKPIEAVSVFLGMTFYKAKDGQIVISKLRATFSVLLVVTNVVLTVWYFKSLTENIITDFAKAETIKFLSVFRDLGSTSIMVFNLIHSYFSSKKMIEQIATLSQVDKHLREMNLGVQIDESRKKMKKNLIILLIVENVVFNTLGEIGSSMVRDTDRILYLVVNMYPRLIIGLMNCTLYAMLMLIQSRFAMINELVSKKITKSQQVYKYPNSFDFCDKISHLVSLHKILVKVTKEVNSIFAFQTLICITMNFILLIGDLHTSMYVIFFDLFYKHRRIVLDMMKNCITYIFELFYLSKRSSDLCNEANRTKVLLLGIRINIDKENERNAVIVSALKLMQNHLEITACKLFKIDNALLFSICGAASSYLFIMLQLDIGDMHLNLTEISSTTTDSYF